MKLECCQLHKREAREFELHGKKPDCKHHGHISLSVAQAWIRRQTHRWVKEGWSVVCQIKHWVVKDGGMQLVDGVDSGRSPRRSYAIGAHGAHGRATRVAQVNNPQRQTEDGGGFLPSWMLP